MNVYKLVLIKLTSFSLLTILYKKTPTYVSRIIPQYNMEKTYEELYFPVEKLPLSKLMSNKPPKGKEFVIMDKNSNAFLSFCSKDYKLRKNSSLYKNYEKSLKQENIPFIKEVNTIDNTKFFVHYILLNSLNSKLITDILPIACIWNSYDGTVKTQIKFGYKKFLANNHFSRPSPCNIHSASKHSSEGKDNTILQFISSTKEFIRQAKNDIAIYEKLIKIPASKKDFDKIINKLKLSPEARDKALVQMEKEKHGHIKYKNYLQEEIIHHGNEISLFSIYSAINFAIHNTNKKELPEIKSKKDCALIEQVTIYAEKIS